MNKPKINKTYIFVRRQGEVLEHTEFVRYEDSAGFAADGCYHVYENKAEVWRDALDELRRLGFVELSQAKTTGLVPAGWEPSSETFVFKLDLPASVREA